MRSHQTSSRPDGREVGVDICDEHADEGIGSTEAASEEGKCFVALESKLLLMTLPLHRLGSTTTFGGLQHARHHPSRLGRCGRETCAIPGFETGLLSSMFGSSMESACDRKAGKRAGIARAAEGIGECD